MKTYEELIVELRKVNDSLEKALDDRDGLERDLDALISDYTELKDEIERLKYGRS